jgi:hypothetical protein
VGSIRWYSLMAAAAAGSMGLVPAPPFWGNVQEPLALEHIVFEHVYSGGGADPNNLRNDSFTNKQ